MAIRLSDYRKYRLLEMIPGVLVWTTLIGAIALSMFKPLWAIYFIIVFDVYWLVRVMYLMTYLALSYRLYAKTISIEWQHTLEQHHDWKRVWHLVIIPTFREDSDVLRNTFQCLVQSRMPLDRFVVVLATEERDRERAQRVADDMRREFGHLVAHFLVTEHPAEQPGEIPGKGSNTAWAGRQAKVLIDRLGIAYEDVIVSSFDVDTCVHPQYFSYLTHTFLAHPNRLRTSYQPVPLFTNNIWDAPALARVAANSTTFWMLTEQARPERLFTFSSHSMSFRALVDVDFWQNDIVTEDSRIFLQGFLRYDGDYSVTPMPISVSMDAVRSKTFWRSMVNLYKQQRRWAYGVENFPFMAWYFPKNHTIPLATKFRYLWNQLEGVYSWATAPIIIFLLGRLPLYFVGESAQTTTIVQNAPFILERLMQVAMIGLVPAAILSTILLPPTFNTKRMMRIPLMIAQWLLFPVVMIVFGSLPATEAQTRLMLGKYLGFWTTEKRR